MMLKFICTGPKESSTCKLSPSHAASIHSLSPSGITQIGSQRGWKSNDVHRIGNRKGYVIWACMCMRVWVKTPFAYMERCRLLGEWPVRHTEPGTALLIGPQGLRTIVLESQRWAHYMWQKILELNQHVQKPAHLWPQTHTAFTHWIVMDRFTL